MGKSGHRRNKGGIKAKIERERRKTQSLKDKYPCCGEVAYFNENNCHDVNTDCPFYSYCLNETVDDIDANHHCL
jgi:hypothetical protein